MSAQADQLEKRVLLVAPTLRDAQITQALLSGEGIECQVYQTLRDVAEQFKRGAGALLLTNECLLRDDVVDLVAALEQQPPWSDIGAVLLMPGGTQSSAADRTLKALRNVTLLERPVPMRSLVSAVQSAIRSRLRQYQSRQRMEALALAERQARQLREQFQAMANSIPQLAWMARPDGAIFWYNQRWHDYCGTTPGDMAGWDWQKVHDPRELPRVVEKWKAALRSEQPWEDTFPLRRHDGEFRWHLSRAMPVRDEAGNVTLWFGTNTDITDERTKAQERERLLLSEQHARAEAERAGRMKDEFLATLSHELRTPLNAILGWSQIVRESPDEQTLAEGLAVIERNARVQAQLIEDLLDMSRIISGKIRLDVQQVECATFVDAAIETVSPAAQAKGIRLQRIIDPAAGSLSGDPHRLQQVVWNLLSNAIKFTPRGGQVQVLVQRRSAHLEISVRDTGVGIDGEFLPHVFERFRQADASTTRSHGGLGLGLAIVKQLVELHGGTIEVASDGRDRGSTFTVCLPIRALPSRSAEQEPPTPRRPTDGSPLRTPVSLAGLSVMVVDDEPDARELIRRVLEERQANVTIAASAGEALQLLQTHRPDILVSDIGMPTMDGYEFLQRVRALGKRAGGGVPAIALTAFARAEDRTRALRAGYLLHLAKPVEPQELLTIVASIGGRVGNAHQASSPPVAG